MIEIHTNSNEIYNGDRLLDAIESFAINHQDHVHCHCLPLRRVVEAKDEPPEDVEFHLKNSHDLLAWVTDVLSEIAMLHEFHNRAHETNRFFSHKHTVRREL